MAEYVVAQLTAEDWKKIELRDILLFGTYPKEENGEPLPIEWEVIDKKDGKFFLLSVYGLDAMPFDSRDMVIISDMDIIFSDEKITWADSELRAWLNGDFWRAAFLPEERRLIAPNKRSDEEEDRVSLLSYGEANQYIEKHRGHHKAAELTPLADAKIRAEHLMQIKFCWRWDRGWWLSSMAGKDQAACVVYDWQLESIKDNYCTDCQGVRPAIWLDPNGNYSTDDEV